MPDPQSSPPAAPSDPPPTDEPLRARKHRETRAGIATAGLDLFLAHGFEATTLDAIAAAAGVARRTIFNHYATKEEILRAGDADLAAAAEAAVAARPAGETPLEAVRAVLPGLVAAADDARARSVDRVVAASEALRPLVPGRWERLERTLAAALARRWPEPALATGLRLAVLIGLAALSHPNGAAEAEALLRDMRATLDEALRGMRGG